LDFGFENKPSGNPGLNGRKAATKIGVWTFSIRVSQIGQLFSLGCFLMAEVMHGLTKQIKL
jgi:hypothetical protein